MWRRPSFLLFLCLASLSSATANAVVVDWDTLTWTPGTFTNSYDVDPAKAGNDVTVTVSGNTPQLQPEVVSPYPQTPAITTNFEGGLGTAQNTLSLAVDFTNKSQSVTVTVDFSSLYTSDVQYVSFSLFDVDASNTGGSDYQDLLSSITATAADGVTLVAPTITASSNNSLSGSSLTQAVNGMISTNDLGAGSGNGNVTINFGAAAIKSFTFTYGSGTAPGADPTYQHVGLHDISFTPVPELNPTWSALGSCLLAAALILRHSARFRK